MDPLSKRAGAGRERMNQKEDFIRRFREIQPKFSRFYARLLSRAHLTLPQFALLSQLTAEDTSHKTLSMTEVGRKLHITKPAVTNLVDRLEKNCFLKRLQHPEDRRLSLLRLLPKGEGIVKKTQGRALQLLLRTFDQFNSHEKKTLARFYQLLSQTLDEVLAQPK